jgi:hypothetical protein
MKGFTYKSYNFVDKDPMIDEIRTVYQDSGANFKWVSEHSGVAPTTISNWFSGTTRRPQAATMNAVLRSLGFKLGVVAYEEPVHIWPPMPQPKPRTPPPATKGSVRHVVQMSKYKRGR